MTKSTRNSMSARRSNRTITLATDSIKIRSSAATKEPSKIQKSKKTSLVNRKSIAHVNHSRSLSRNGTETEKGPVINIVDFKNYSGKTMYLVSRQGGNESNWETEDLIENLEVLSNYQQRVRTDSGYSISDTIVSNRIDIDIEQHLTDGISKRPSRASKIHAVISLKRAIEDENTYTDDDLDKNNSKRNTKQKSAVSVNKKARKTKAETFAETQAQDRANRVEQRKNLDSDEIVCSLDHNLQGENVCCLMCGANVYRALLEKDDFEGFKAVIQSSEYPSYSNEDSLNGLSVLSYSLLLEKANYAQFAEEFDSRTNKPAGFRKIVIPEKYTTYQDNTGRNVRMGIYGNRAFKQVQEARGNRIGKSAFYKSKNRDFTNKTHLNVEDGLITSHIREFIPFVCKPIFQKQSVIEDYTVHKANGPKEAYFVVSAGNYRLGAEIIGLLHNAGGSTFNRIHLEVLKSNDKKPLDTFRKNQAAKISSDANNLTPFFCAAIKPSSAHLAELYEVLDAAEQFATDSFGRSVVFFAAASETSACLEFLHSKKFNFTLHDKYKMTPLIQAARFGRSHNVEFLIKVIKGEHNIAEASSDTLFQSLLRNKRTALHYAAFFGHADTCRMLVQYKCPIDAVEGFEKQTALHYASRNGYLDCVRVLIEEGKADPEKGDKYSRSALHLACIEGHLEIVKYLLSIGCNANAPDSSQNHPIHFAAAFGYLKIIHLLINYGGADPTLSNAWRDTACSVAHMKGHIGIVKYLVNLPNNVIDVNFKDQDGLTMLQHAIRDSNDNEDEGKINIKNIKLLLSLDADVNTQDTNGNTPLHFLAANNSFAEMLPKGWYSFYPKGVYEYISDKDTDDMDGVNYLVKLANLLISHGADVLLENKTGETALSVAISKENHNIVATLLESGARFWLDTLDNGNNFFHYFCKYTAFVSGMSTHQKLDVLCQKRHIELIGRLWNFVENSMTDGLDIHNALNNNGYSPLIYGLVEAIDIQKKAIKKEKELVSVSLQVTRPNNQHPGNYQMRPSKNFEAAKKPINVSFQFDLKLWVEYMNKLCDRFAFNMDLCVDLPKDFKKKNPKAKIADYPKFTGYTALHFACQTQCVEIIHFLLKKGCNPNLRVNIEGSLGDTPMIIGYHLKNNDNQEHPQPTIETNAYLQKTFNIQNLDCKNMLKETVQILLQHDACPYIANSTGNTPLIKAASHMDLENIDAMCKKTPSVGSNVNTRNEDDETALMAAITSLRSFFQSGKEDPKVDVIKFLLQTGANLNTCYEDGDTVFMKIIRISHLPLLQVTLEYTMIPIDHNHQNKKSETDLSIACQLPTYEVAHAYLDFLSTYPDRSLLSNIDSLDANGATPLMYAALRGDLQIINKLFSLGADSNCCTPTKIPLSEAVKSKNYEAVETILNHGAHINEYDVNKNSALHYAVLSEKHRIVCLLLERGAKPNVYNKKLQTPLHLAIEVSKKQINRSFRIERLLLKAGSDVNAVDFFGRTPLHYVFVDSNIIPITRNTKAISKKVKQIMADIVKGKEEHDKLTKYCNHLDIPLNVTDPATDVNCPNQDEIKIGRFLYDAKKLQNDITAAELKKSTTTNDNDDNEIIITDKEKEALQPYCDYSWEKEDQQEARSDPVDIFKYLSEIKGISFDVKDEFERTPLHYAASVGAFSCTSLLVDAKVDIDAVDSDQNGALQLALRNNHVDFSVMLCNFGASPKSDMVLKNGKSITTFGFSLSNSLINMTYLIMSRGVTLIESIQDALKHGNFQLVEVLMDSCQDNALLEVLKTSGKNIWHVVSDFRPFSNEIWEEYLPDIIKRLTPLNIELCSDAHSRTPIHYAAKHGQVTLLKHLLSLQAGECLNILDEKDKTELYYAVESLQTETIEMLLAAGSKIEGLQPSKNPSILSISAKAKSLKFTRFLLEQGASVDEDSMHGRENSVMIATLDGRPKLLELLFQYGANASTPSYLERKSPKDNKIYKGQFHPLFVAAKNNNQQVFEVLLKNGANPNIYGDGAFDPEISLFAYTVTAVKSKTLQELLLNYNVDLNITDATTERTIFYQLFFAKMEHNTIETSKDKTKPSWKNVDHAVYEKILQSNNLNVNIVDSISGMTPLEFAIREKNMIIIERLLALGADVNKESCCVVEGIPFNNLMNQSRRKLPSIVHAVCQNNIKIVKTLCEKSTIDINWTWLDDENRSVLSYTVGSMDGFSYENGSMLEYFAKQMRITTFRRLMCNTNDCYGKPPISYVRERKTKALIESIIKIDIIASTYSIQSNQTLQKDTVSQNSGADSANYITTEKVEEDAQAEREILQKEQDKKKAKEQKSSKKKEDDDLAKVDPYSKLEKVGEILYDENKQPYDIMLSKSECVAYVSVLDVTFYKMSIIYNKVMNFYILWTRWGKFGQEGQHQKTPFFTSAEAILEFKSIFKSKSGNSWEDRLTSFTLKPNRYELVTNSHHPKDTIIKDFDFMSSAVTSQLSNEILEAMSLICNHTYLSRVYSDTNIDMPFGQVPQSRIEEARQVLTLIPDLLVKHITLSKSYNDKAKKEEAKTILYEIGQLSIKYGRLIPYISQNKGAINSFFDYSHEFIKKQSSKICDLSYVVFAANVVLAAKHRINEINPLDYAYRSLNCTLKPIPFSVSSQEYQLIKQYMDSTSDGSQELLHLFEVNRMEEAIRFEPYKDDPNRKLLWHGSRVGNFMGILKQGLRVRPSTSQSQGAMLGNGVYFADTFKKSMTYAKDTYGSQQSIYKILMLCEVALGDCDSSYKDSNQQVDENKAYDSIKGQGNNIPDPNNEVSDSNGVIVPLGPCIAFDPSTISKKQTQQPNISQPTVGFGTTPINGAAAISYLANRHRNPNHSFTLNDNEYVVYNEDRVKIRYLLIVKDTSVCTLCANNGSYTNMTKPINKHNVKEYKYDADFNMYEAEVVKAYLTQTGKTAQNIYDENLIQFIKDGLYKKKWNTPLDISLDSKICSTCAFKITSELIEKKITGNQAIPNDCTENSAVALDLLNQRPQCKYGKECQTQNHKMSHAKKYKHWFAENIATQVEITTDDDNAMLADDDEETSSVGSEDSMED